MEEKNKNDEKFGQRGGVGFISERGLSDEEVIRSRARHGSNRFTEKKQKSFLGRLLGGFGDPIIRILLIALAVTLIMPGGDGGNFDAAAIGIAVLISVFVSTLCEYGSEKAFKRMQREAGEQKCRVIRGGFMREVGIDELVVGDTVVLRAGERIPADGVLTNGAVSCDLSALNGESTEQRKLARTDGVSEERFGCETGEDALTDQSTLFRGGEITAGEGYMEVTAVGDRSYYGRMAVELQTDSGESPLKRRLSKLAVTLSKFGYFCAAAVGVSDLLFNTVFEGEFVFSLASVSAALLHALTLAVSVVVMAVPEGLPMMITVVLASNMVRMQKENVMVRKPVGIETAGNINILFTDKTGTLTYGKPAVSGYIGNGYEAESFGALPEPIKRIYGAISLNAVSCAVDTSGALPRSVGGDVTDRAVADAALLDGGGGFGLGDRIAFLPFNSEYKLCAASVKLPWLEGGKELTLIKGAPEILLEFCRSVYTSDGGTVKADTVKLRQRMNAIASTGVRVLAAVTSECGAAAVRDAAKQAAEKMPIDISSILINASLVCFICIRDTPRTEARESVIRLTGAGIRTVMITGDNPLTASAIAKEVGILSEGDGGTVLTGGEVASMSDAELEAVLPRLRVVARALPQDKSRLVRIAKRMGFVVGMTGDGLNDAPALKQADVGFAMGSGTEVAKEAGDIVITDNNIASIVKAVLFGRTIFRSIRKFIVFQLTMNLCAVGISIIGPFIGYESPVTVMQMLWINIIIDTLAAVAFAGEAPLPSYMNEPPLPKDEPVLSPDMMTKIFALGVYTLMLCIYFLISRRTSEVFLPSEGDKRILTGFFALFIFSGMLGSLNARTDRLRLFDGLLSNPVFITVMTGVFTAQTAMIYYGGKIFDTVPLTGRELRYVLGLSLTVVVFGRVFELVRRIGSKDAAKEEKTHRRLKGRF